jgi:formylmethanofuran dehydrogenase subunit E
LDAPTREDRIFLFWQREAGSNYRAQVAAWEAARATEEFEAAEAERLIAQSMAETPTIACQVCGNRFEEHELDVHMRCRSCVGANLQPRTARHTETP